MFLYNLTTGQVIRRFRGHKGIVNSVDVQVGGAGRGLIASASDDGNVLVWDEDEKAPVETIELGYPLTSVSRSAPQTSLVERHVWPIEQVLPNKPSDGCASD